MSKEPMGGKSRRAPARMPLPDAPYARGRLVVTPRGGGRFAFALVRGVGKGASEVIDQWESLGSPSVSGEDAKVQRTPGRLEESGVTAHAVHTGLGTALRSSLSCMIDGNDP